MTDLSAIPARNPDGSLKWADRLPDRCDSCSEDGRSLSLVGELNVCRDCMTDAEFVREFGRAVA